METIMVIDEVRISVQHIGTDWERRAQYSYRISDTTTDEKIIYGEDIFGGVGFPADTDEALRTLASFLSAWIEAHQYGGPDSENADLFPIEALPRIEAVADEISMLAIDPADLDY